MSETPPDPVAAASYRAHGERVRVLTDRDREDEVPTLHDLDIVSWRFDQLEGAGYPVDIAVMLAERADVDLHLACELLAAGSPIHTALRILT